MLGVNGHSNQQSLETCGTLNKSKEVEKENLSEHDLMGSWLRGSSHGRCFDRDDENFTRSEIKDVEGSDAHISMGGSFFNVAIS